MRHSDINLTMSIYTHTLRGQAQKAIESLPDLSLRSSQRQKATGADDKPVGGAYKKLTKKSDFFRNWNVSDVTNWHSGYEKDSLNGDVSKSLKSKPLGTKKEQMSTTDIGSKDSTPGRTRTSDLRIRNPLLYPTELRALKYLSACNIITSYTSCQPLL
jgi:hypothetical protein